MARLSLDRREPHAVDVREILRRQFEPTAEFRLPEPRERLILRHWH